MNRFYSSIIEPILKAAKPKTIVEIGAFAGANTKNLLRFCQNGAVLHVIDPNPQFDYQKLCEKYENTLFFHKDLSLRVIPDLSPFDVAVIDGDHNWYTVYNELKQIESLHDYSDRRFPILFFHDVAWPYARRDLYYSSSEIPAEFRNPCAQMGITWDRSELIPNGGLNKQLFNALYEGGAQNGVLTAIEDFMSESSLSLELIKIPAYFGIGILYTKKRYRRDRHFRRSIIELMSSKGLLRIMEVLESLRAKDMIVMQEQRRELDRLRQKEAMKEGQLKQCQCQRF